MNLNESIIHDAALESFFLGLVSVRQRRELGHAVGYRRQVAQAGTLIERVTKANIEQRTPNIERRNQIPKQISGTVHCLCEIMLFIIEPRLEVA